MGQCTRYSPNENTPLKEVIFTENAAKKVAGIIEEEGNAELKLRLIVKVSGCAGLEYNFELDDIKNNDDYAMTTHGVTLLIDERSYGPVSGATIDYVEDLEGERFTINNPNATKMCGCGKSFDIADPENT